MKRTFIKITMIVVILTLPFACRHEEILLANPEIANATKLGKRLENPYSVKNMKKALENLKVANANARVAFDELEIAATHLYVKFEPKTEDELDFLMKDTTVAWFDHPLDYEIEEGGEYYHDPSLPMDQPTYQYASLDVDYPIPTEIETTIDIIDPVSEQPTPIVVTKPMKSYIEDELFIPDDGTFLAAYRSEGMTKELIDALVYEAYRITDNLEDLPHGAESGRMEATTWYPQGVIKVWDDVVQDFVPVHDVEVRARRWFTTRRAKTNINGEFRAEKGFKNQANYSIRWEKYHFSVRSGTFGQAGYNGPKKEGSWTPDFGRVTPGSSSSVVLNPSTVSNNQQYYALIFQAARDYYYGNRFGLTRPPENGTFRPQTKIAADISDRQNEKKSHAAFYVRTGGILPTLYIRTWEGKSDYVYATTTHELAHYAHWSLDRDAFRKLAALAYVPPFGIFEKSSEAVIESWPTGVEWMFAQERYKNRFGRSYYNYNSGGQYQRVSPYNEGENDLIYTSIVIDMIDMNNQREARNSNQYPQDSVSGFTIRQIEQALEGSESWDQWKNRMISMHPNNPTGIYINELYSNWY